MDSQGRKVVVCDNGTGVSVTLSSTRVGSAWMTLYSASVCGFMKGCERDAAEQEVCRLHLILHGYTCLTHDLYGAKHAVH